jgi:hypothetical protein
MSKWKQKELGTDGCNAVVESPEQLAFNHFQAVKDTHKLFIRPSNNIPP